MIPGQVEMGKLLLNVGDEEKKRENGLCCRRQVSNFWSQEEIEIKQKKLH